MATLSGVKRYITGTATVTVHFPVGFNESMEINCYQCPFFSRSSGICRLNGAVTAFPQKYIGAQCPLELDLEGEEDR